MTQKKVLGRGLEALIPQKSEPAPSGLLEVLVSQIAPNPYQPRQAFDEGSLTELTRSVEQHGVVQPLLVTRVGDRYRLIAGERRFRAAQRAGLQKVPVVVKELARETDALELALIENIQREDLNPMEEALAYQQLHEEFGLTQEEISRRVGKERSTVANFLRLLKLPERVKSLVAAGKLSMGHARALLAVSSPRHLEELAEKVMRRSLNVRQTELLTAAPRKRNEEGAPKDIFTRDAEEKLTRILRTRVAIERKKRGGKIVVHFSGEDDLIRIYEDLSGRKR